MRTCNRAGDDSFESEADHAVVPSKGSTDSGNWAGPGFCLLRYSEWRFIVSRSADNSKNLFYDRRASMIMMGAYS
jgi:hypothetical protein